uniref:Putative presegetalin F1 n=1 Tax=Gypsophila vaccaria TaxID=39387 RepID=F6LNM3_GYPVA|nr:Chain L, Putative presegetalin F1 [Gypsophila vaccaria]5O3U_M Chain M, Putative presegetalin F1 [Gypsophila vaccaria]5O3U_N Chain N, Putative presegetalin F1 [Gypsophila vaccaria]5O3U_O Chain O, Putative presegetalin F1 [Gypsophila vaccaria]AEG75788.1 putative presegetalin F1 [Gypsophila vaccaria]AEG75789.1 putative presegetalin F1 [Gypsophila vaccaria]AEG75790.1 putative presegetalin F1 [Gypsophila vaccaria]
MATSFQFDGLKPSFSASYSSKPIQTQVSNGMDNASAPV